MSTPAETPASQYRLRTAQEMGLAGNHWDAIQKHLDAYEAAIAHELAEKQRAFANGTAKAFGEGERAAVLAAADLVDPVDQ